MAVPRITPAVQEKPAGMPAQRPLMSVSDVTKVDRALVGLGQQIQQTAAIGAEVVRKKNRLAAKDAAARYDEAIDALETEYQDTKRGVNAENLGSLAEEELTRIQGEVSEGLTDAQKAIFQRYAMRQRSAALNRATKFQNRQLTEAEAEINAQIVERAQKNYANMPTEEQRGLATEQITEAIDGTADLMGWSPQKRQAEIEKALSNVDTVVVQSLINNGEFEQAASHLKRYGKTMAPKNRVKLEQRIDNGMYNQRIDTAVDVEFASVMKDGGGAPTYANWDKRIEKINAKYGDMAREVKHGLQVMMREWKSNDDLASQRQYNAFVTQMADAERSPTGYMDMRDNIINNARNAMVRDKALAELERTLGPEAAAYDTSEPIGGQIAYDFRNALEAGHLGPLTAENVPAIMAKGVSFGLKKKDIQDAIEGARKADGIKQSVIRTAVGRATGTGSEKDNWLDKHPEVWHQIEQFSRANPAMTQQEAIDMAINMAVEVQTDQGTVTAGRVARFDQEYGDVMLEDYDDASIVEIEEARAYLKMNGIDANEDNISRRVAGQRINNIIEIRNTVKQRMANANRMKLDVSPGTVFAPGDDRVLPAFDTASEPMRTAIILAMDNGMPEGEAIMKYGQAARDYYAYMEWARSDQSTDAFVEYADSENLQDLIQMGNALAAPFNSLFAQ